MRFNTKIGAVVLATVIAFTASVATTSQVWAQDNAPTVADSVNLTPREEVRQAGLEAAAAVRAETVRLAQQLGRAAEPAVPQHFVDFFLIAHNAPFVLMLLL